LSSSSCRTCWAVHAGCWTLGRAFDTVSWALGDGQRAFELCGGGHRHGHRSTDAYGRYNIDMGCPVSTIEHRASSRDGREQRRHSCHGIRGVSWKRHGAIQSDTGGSDASRSDGQRRDADAEWQAVRSNRRRSPLDGCSRFAAHHHLMPFDQRMAKSPLKCLCPTSNHPNAQNQVHSPMPICPAYPIASAQQPNAYRANHI
jgi:hypothetical protein